MNERRNIEPISVKLIEFGAIEIEDRTGEMYRYLADNEGQLVLGQIIRYPVKVDEDLFTVIMFCPVAPYRWPWVLGAKK